MPSPSQAEIARARGVLGVPPHASRDEIKSAYRAKTREHHPDRNAGDVDGASVRFRLATEAYELLRELPERPRPTPMPERDFSGLDDFVREQAERERERAPKEAKRGSDVRIGRAFDTPLQPGDGVRFEYRVIRTCNVCNGCGIRTPECLQCYRCHGDGLNEVAEWITMRMPTDPAAMAKGKLELRRAGAGDDGSEPGMRGDLYVVVTFTPA